jgi:GT2 family glycosyltransferase
MVALVARPQVGAVGAKLLYPSGKVQHAGVGLGIGGVAGHLFYNAGADDPGYFGRLQLVSKVSAVTGACLAIRRSDFELFGGFDEGYWNGYEDVDLCLAVRAAGGTVVYEPTSVVTHLESQSGPERWTGVAANVARLRDKWEAHQWQ